MNAMNFAWTILKMPRESSLDDDFRAMREFVLQNHNNPDPQIQEDVENVYRHLTQIMSARRSGAPAPTLMKPPRIEGTGMEGMGMTTGTSTPSQLQPSSRVEKYDPSTYNQPGQALPMGQRPPKDPEMARRSRQQRTMEAGAERGRMQSQRDRVMDEMKETGITQDAMGVLPFQELMRASKTPEGMARIQQMIRERRGAGAAGRGADPQTDRIQMSEPMDAIDAAWAVLKSV